MDVNKTAIAATMAAMGLGAVALPTTVSAVGLVDGFYDMVIHNTPYSGGYQFGTDGAWNSSFTFNSLPGAKGSSSYTMYDDTFVQPVNGKYAGAVGDGVQGTIGIRVEGGVITGTGKFEFDTLINTVGGDFTEYGGSSGFTGSIDSTGNINLAPTGLLGTYGNFPTLVDKRWNVDNFNGASGAGTTNFVPNTANNNTAYDSFSTGTATNDIGMINGAAYDGTTAILVKGGHYGSDWVLGSASGFFGANYFEVWNIGFTFTGDLPAPVPLPAAIWLFGSGLIGLFGTSRYKRKT